jgi:hypothetical protein
MARDEGTIDWDTGYVTAVGPPVEIRMRGDSVGAITPVFGTSQDWAPFIGQEVGLLIRVEGGRRSRICTLGPRLPK